MKACSKCKKSFPISKFNYCKKSTDGLHSWCAYCKLELDRKLKKTKRGVISNIYGEQLKNSRKRGHKAPSYSNAELQEWASSSMMFSTLFDIWITSGYEKDCKPSIDRIDDYKGYSLKNIQIVSFKQNRLKYSHQAIIGVNTKRCKKVIMKDLSGEVLKYFHSATNASRETGFAQGSISRCCRGERKTCSGYLWEYADDNRTL